MSIISTADAVLPSLVKTAKRPVALVAGYLGTGYHGLQMSPLKESLESTKVFPTIENELRKALVGAKFISELNSMDLGKVKWCRSSRTDKGVHAARIVFSAKLELPKDPSEENPNTLPVDQLKPLYFPQVAEECNKLLPPQIRIYSCTKVNSGFSARNACHWRSYEYVMPIDLLFGDEERVRGELPESVVTQKMQAFNGILQQMEGSHSFHNFHRLKAKNLLGGRRPTAKVQRGAEEAEVVEEEEAEDDTEAETEVAAAAQQRRATDQMYDSWTPEPRPVVAKTFGNIYTCRAELVESAGGAGRRLVKVRIAGQSFLLHQIRLMMSAAILSARGILPPHFIQTALAVPFHLPLPLAPAEGLLLHSSGYGRNINRQDWALAPALASSPRELCLMTQESFTQSEAFLQTVIYPRIERDWETSVCAEYEHFMQRFAVPVEVSTRWVEMLHAAHAETLSEEARCLPKEVRRVEKNVAAFNQLLSDSASPAQGKKPVVKTLVHQEFLPNGITTQMAVQFQTLPGLLSVRVARSLATQIALGQLPPLLSVNELLRIVADHYGDSSVPWSSAHLHKYADELPSHPLIV